MPKNIALDVAEILSATGDLPLTTGIYNAGGITETVQGLFWNRALDPSETGLDSEIASFAVELTQFTLIDTWAPDDLVTINSKVWRVAGQQQRQAHLLFSLQARTQRAQAATPLTILGNSCVLWLDASDSSTITSGVNGVSSWADKSGAGLVPAVTQTVDANKPNVATGAIGGLDAIYFNSVNSERLTALTTPVTAAPFKVFMVAQADSAATRIMLEIWGGLQDYWRGNTVAGPDRLQFAIFDGVTSIGIITTADYTALTPFLMSLFETLSTDHEVQIDGGGSGTSASDSSPDNADRIAIGGRYDGVSTHLGHICEVVVVDESAGAISAAQLTALETYLERWGLTIP